MVKSWLLYIAPLILQFPLQLMLHLYQQPVLPSLSGDVDLANSQELSMSLPGLLTGTNGVRSLHIIYPGLLSAQCTALDPSASQLLHADPKTLPQ